MKVFCSCCRFMRLLEQCEGVLFMVYVHKTARAVRRCFVHVVGSRDCWNSMKVFCSCCRFMRLLEQCEGVLFML